MKRWFKHVKENIIYVLASLLLITNLFAVYQGYTNRRSMDDATSERAEYLETSRELVDRLHESEALARESLRDIRKLGQLHAELREQIEEFGRIAQAVGDDSIGIGITSDENLRIIRELRRRYSENEEE